MFTGICIRFLAVALACCHPTPVSVTCLTLVTEAVSHLVNMLVKRTAVLRAIVHCRPNGGSFFSRDTASFNRNTEHCIYTV